MVNPVAPTTVATSDPAKATAPVVNTPSQQTEVKSPKAEDILKRVGAKTEAPSIVASESELFSSADLKAHLETITDPGERAKFEGVYKNMEKGLQRKFQKISELERKIKESDTWTPERLQKELNRPDFLDAATRVTQTQQQATPPQGYQGNDWSALSPQEQAEIKSQRNELQRLREEHATLAGSLAVEKADLDIKQRIPTYDADRVNQLQDELRQGKWNAQRIREALWKADNFDRVVEQTYDLAMQDKSGVLQEKKAATTMPGTNANTQTPPATQAKGESRAGLFRRLALENIQRLGRSR